MTRIDLTTRELHGLIAPVIPHASTDAELPQLNTVHLQVRGNVLYAVATDRFTMAATRLALHDPVDDFDVTIDRADAAAMLRLFTFSKEDDPNLTLIIDKFPIPISPGTTLDGLGLRIDGEDGTRLVLHDRGAADVKPFAKWQELIGSVVHRENVPATPALILTPSFLPRWTKAAGKGERLTVFVGPEQGDPILFTVEDHFVGIWKPATHLEEPTATLADNPWRAELPARHSGPDNE